MKSRKLFATTAVAVASLVSASSWGFSFTDIKYWVGSGTNECAVVIDFNDGSVMNSSFAWGYRWNGDAPSFKAILDEIAADDPRLASFISDSGWVSGFGYDVDDDGGTFQTGKTYAKSDKDDLFPQPWYEYDDSEYEDDEIEEPNMYMVGDDWAAAYATGKTFEDLEWRRTDAVTTGVFPVNGQWLAQRFASYAMEMTGWSYIVDEFAPEKTPAAATRTYRLADNELWIGHGTNEAGVVVSWGVGKTRAWGYRWNGEAPTVKKALADISAADKRLVPHYASMGGYTFLDTFGYDAGDVGGVAYDWANYTASDESAWVAPYLTDYVDPDDWNTWIYHYFTLLTEPDAYYHLGASAYQYASLGVDEQPLQPGTWVIFAYNEGEYLADLDAAEPARSASLNLSGVGEIKKSNAKVGQTASWKAVAASGSVFSHWEGDVVDALGLSANALRNPNLKFKVPAESEEPAAVFAPIDADGLSKLWLEGDQPLEAGVPVASLFLRDDSLSYVKASVKGLPPGMKFNAADLSFGGTPKSNGTYILTVTAKNASGYQMTQVLKLVVGEEDPSVEVPELAYTQFYPLTLVVADGGGTVKGTGVYAMGRVVTASASPDKGHVFAGWFADAACTVPADVGQLDHRTPSVKVRIPDVRYLVAKFVVKGAETDPVSDLACNGADETGTLTMMVGVRVESAVSCSSFSLPSYAAKSFPSGVSVSKTTGEITGVPTKAGTFNAQVVVGNASEKRTLPITINVLPLPEWAAGSFVGLAEQQDVEPGFATLTVGKTGKISGKVELGGTNWTFSASGYDTFKTVDGKTSLSLAGEARHVGAGKAASYRAFSFMVNAPSNGTWNASTVTGTFGDAEYGAHRVIWADSKAAKDELTANWTGSYQYATEDGDVLTLKVQNSGVVAFAGTLANGRSVKGSTPLLHEDAADIRSPFAIAYAPPATVKVKDGNKTITVPCPAFCDIIKFKYETPEPGGPAVRK